MIEIRHKETHEVLRVVEADSLLGADLRDDILDGADLRGADLSGAWLQEADLMGADLAGATLQGAILIRTQLDKADLTGALFEEAKLSDGSPGSGAVLTNCKMRGRAASVLRHALRRPPRLGPVRCPDRSDRPHRRLFS